MLATHAHAQHPDQPFGAPSFHPHFHQPHFPSCPPPQLFLPPVPLPPASSVLTQHWRSISQPAPSCKRRFEETEDDSAEQGGSPPKKLAVGLVQPEREIRSTSIGTLALRAEDEAVMPEVETALRRHEGGGGFEMGEMCW